MVERLKLKGETYSGKVAVNCLFCGARVETEVAGKAVADAYAAAQGQVPAVFGKEGEVVTAAGGRLDLVDLRLRCPACGKHFPVKVHAAAV